MPQGRLSTRARADTVRLKRDIARADSTVRGLSRIQAESSLSPTHPTRRALQELQRRTFQRARAQEDTVKQMRTAAPKPSTGHKSFAENVEAFDGAALGERPPRVTVPLGHPARDRLPAAVGHPAGVQTANGVDNLRANSRTLQAGDSRAQSSGLKPTRAAVARFGGGSV